MNILEQIAQALNSDDPDAALLELQKDAHGKLKIMGIDLPEPKQSYQHEMMEALIEHMAGITCIMYLRQDDCVAAIKNVYSLSVEWVTENHHCEKEGDHEIFLRELLIWTRITTETFLGVDGEKALR